MSDARVAIVVRTQDRPAFLSRALRSILRQTFEAWECVIVNDGGDADAVAAVLDALPEDGRDRFRVVSADAPRGRWVSANTGVLATSAPLLVLHDDDDTWHPEFLRRAVAHLDADPRRDAALSRIEIVWEEKRDGEYVPVRREVFQPELGDALLSDALLFNRFVPIGFVYRRTLHEELGLYDAELPVVGDWAFNLRVLARGPIPYFAEEPYAYWHQRADGTGADGNSVISARDAHARTDALVRDRALREYVDEHGMGLVLYLTKFIDRRFVEVEAGIRREIAATRDEIARGGLARRGLRRLRRTLLTRRA
ncbi:glycosyltransferase family 2 protein [Microbacterium sp. NPDC096154]|uniref:glycosyltransferase family 2 protein n=1 Tax=Microbacterium sp. NPDC096154 TaxID=3155549 RepID=UPI00332F1D96